MAWWQKKLLRYGLRYGLSRTGLLDDSAIDLDNLDITVGRQNVIELKDVGLNIKRISQLAQLPPALRLETARILHLKLTIPADFYHSSIVVKVDGVEVVAKLDDIQYEDAAQRKQAGSRARSPGTARTPQHRKTNRRRHSPPPYDPGGPDQHVRLPNVQDVAKSFLMEEPADERRDLEAMAYGSRGMEESIASESSEGEAGTGTGVGVPGFLTNFLQGIVERFQLEIKDVEVRIETEVQGDAIQSMPVALRLRVGAVGVDRVDQSGSEKSRSVSSSAISIDLLSKDEVIAEFSNVPLRSSVADSRSGARSQKSTASFAGVDKATVDIPATTEDPNAIESAITQERSSSGSDDSADHMMHSALEPTMRPESPSPSPSPSPAQDLEKEAFPSAAASGNLADAYGDELPYAWKLKADDLDIQPGDDNISWGSRRRKASAPTDDLWNSMISEDDLPEPLRLTHPARVSTPGARSSRSGSPLAFRQRRAMSPYDRGITSPGSWPRPGGSPPVKRQQAPESWPTMDRSFHSAADPLDRLLVTATDDMIDNKVLALEQARSGSPVAESERPPDPPCAMDDSMLESRVFSHEEAQSMYMSAMTGSQTLNMPGGWGSDTQSVQSTTHKVVCPTGAETPDERDSDLAQLHGAQQSMGLASGNATPRARTPVPQDAPSSSSPGAPELAARQLLHVDHIAMTIPSMHTSMSEDAEPQYGHPGDAPRSANMARGMPGTFSAYSELSASRRRGVGSVHTDMGSVQWSPGDNIGHSTSKPFLDVTVGSVLAQMDISTGQLLYKISNKLTTSLQQPEAGESRASSSPAVERNPPPVSLHVQQLRICLAEQINTHRALTDAKLPPEYGLVDLGCQDIVLKFADTTTVQVGELECLLGGQDLLSFDETANVIAQSTSLTDQAPAVAINIMKNNVTVNGRSVTEVSVQTKPVMLTLDLSVFDEAFNTFGGLSGVLDRGNSILSDSGLNSPVTSKQSKGVRFAGEPESGKVGSEMKVNAHIGGITTTLRSSSCALTLRTSTIKSVYREAGVNATISRILLSGPYCGSRKQEPSLTIDLASLRVEYLFAPQDKDLERLLSLLTPSRDQYDDDGDILIDTLLRQRRKGALLRLSIGEVKAKLNDFECLTVLSSLGDDLAKLSAVAKYLPEDDKPGLLTLLRIKDAEARAPVNDRFGSLICALQDLHLAHVGLPALLAFSIGNIFARQSQGPDLLHSLLPFTGADNIPVVMARMIGNEIEPTIKVKLFNLCFEYSVPIVLDLTGMDRPLEPEKLINDIAQSIANLTMAEASRQPAPSPMSEPSSAATKKMAISLLVHDSAIGLTPQKLPSKALIVLNNAHMMTTVPPGDTMSAKLEIRKAAIFITDRVVNESRCDPLPSNANTALRLTDTLSQQGFVSVGSIMSAAVHFFAKKSGSNEGTKSIEVDVKNELFLLETCADSTQTLFATLGALTPPSPPSKVPKYLTQPMPIEDMMASFSGDPFVQLEEKPEMLFDVEHDPDDIDPEDLLGVSTFEDTDDLLAASEMTSSLYGPVSGLLGLNNDPDEGSSVADYPETAESLLEEDPFEMTTSPEDVHLGDAALMRDLRRQCQPAVSSEPVDLGLYEIEDLGFDALGSGQQALGVQHRFNAPFVGKRGRTAGKAQQDIPFRLRLRDVNFIWHLHDGYDWQRTRDGIVDAVEQVEQRAEERKARRRRSRQDPEDDESVIGDFLFNSIYIGVPADLDAQDLRRQINRGIDQDISETESVPVSGISRPTTHSASGQPRHRQAQRRRLKLGRSRSHKIAFELKAVSADVAVFPPGGDDVVSSVDLRVKDFEIFDKVPTSTWRKFLTHFHNDPTSREMSKPMFHIQLDNVKTLESHSASEIVLHVTVLPLRLHVDQDALDFITRFFEFKDSEMVDQGEPGEKPFLQRVEIDTVDLCLDYKPKTVDYAGLRSGRTKEFMNFVTLEGCNIRLKHAIIYGLQSFDLLHDTLSDVWTPDVMRNQLPRVLSGLAPVRSLVNLGIGVRDVIAIPVREYKKDGRIVRSIQKGAFQFGKTTASELARLGAKVALGTQTMLSNAEELLAPGSSTSGRYSSSPGQHDAGHIPDEEDHERQRAVSAYANQPLGVLSGLRSARRHLEHDLLTARDALIAVQGEVLESRGPGGVAGAVVKHAPTVILRPVIAATRAVGTALLGVGNAVDRGNLRRVEDKYKPR